MHTATETKKFLYAPQVFWREMKRLKRRTNGIEIECKW